MKKAATTILCLSAVSFSFAQLKVDVQTTPLNANGKSSDSRFVSAVYNTETKETKLIFNTSECVSSRGGGYITYSAVKYNFENIVVDEKFQFKTIEKSTVEGLDKALEIAPVIGPNSDFKLPFGYTNGANRKGAWLNQMEIHPKVNPAASIHGYVGCSYDLVAEKTKFEISFEGKGLVSSLATTDGVMVLTQEGSGEDLVIKSLFYDHQGNVKQQSEFKIPYGFAIQTLALKTKNQHPDLVLIVQPTDKYSKYGIKVNKIKENPLEFEFIRIDGNTMEVKERFSFNAVNTQWYVDKVVEDNGAVYVFGQSSKKVELCDYMFGVFTTIEGGNFSNYVRIDKLENYQVMKVKDGKLSYIKSYTPKDMEKVQTAIPGAKGGNSPSGYFRLQEIKFANNKVFITGQNSETAADGDKRKEEFLMILSETGDLSNLFYIPKKGYANSNLFFNAGNTSMIWAIYDYSEFYVAATRMTDCQLNTIYNKVLGGSDHQLKGTTKNDDGPQLQLVKFDLSNNTPSPLQICGKDEYTLFDEKPVLYANPSEIVFLGTAGKNKERVAKFIKVGF